MKLQLKSLGNITTDIEVSSDDMVDTIRQKLIEVGKVSADYIVKLIESGCILDLDKRISEYPNLKDEGTVIYIQTKKKIPETKTQTQVPQPSVPIQPDVSTQSPIVQSVPQTQNQTQQAPLPSTFNGINMDMFRQFTIMNVIGRVLSNPQLFSQILIQDPNMSLLRSNNQIEFDDIINHPSFLAAGINTMAIGDDLEESNMFSIGQSTDESLSEEGTVNPSDNLQGASAPVRIILTQDEKQFIDEIRQMAPHVSHTEIIQYYLACGKDRDVTVNMVLNIPHDN